jgi:hypothetical protein
MQILPLKDVIPLVLLGPLLVPVLAALFVRRARLGLRLTVAGFVFVNTLCVLLFFLSTRR